ncbi:MAG: hypothetical protein IPL71_12875 [Anaerolineales bacterium]|uniref:hypothetical protein n=1 Tax=Candidatus Villigracilis proximus TaxID=3140683 RepID=UPI0031354A98|nr:hypothetical protein [Anaerolineales bacterium]
MDIKIRTKKYSVIFFGGQVGWAVALITNWHQISPFLFTGTGLQIFINPDLSKMIQQSWRQSLRRSGNRPLFSLFILSVPIFQSIRQSGMVRRSRITYAHAAQALLLLFVYALFSRPARSVVWRRNMQTQALLCSRSCRR